MSARDKRLPPRPRYINDTRRGHCKFCGDPIIKNGKLSLRSQWHPHCALRWTIMNSPRDARRFVFVRDRGTCKKCTRYCGPDDPGTVQDIINDIMSPEHKQGSTVDLGRWELDHVIPLKHANGRPECWQLGNMQTLCHDCHTIKTREDKIKYGDVDTRS